MTAGRKGFGPEPGAHAKILVMEDDSDMARAMKMVLSKHGYEVDTAPTGRSALVQMQRKEYDLLFADLFLPDIDGMDVIKRVKVEHPNTAVVVITGFSTVSSAVEAMKLGVFDYLAKPVTAEELSFIAASAIKGKMAKPAKAHWPRRSDAEAAKLIEKREVLNALSRSIQHRRGYDPPTFRRKHVSGVSGPSSEDEPQCKKIIETGTDVIKDYPLAFKAETTIVSGEMKLLSQQADKITPKQFPRNPKGAPYDSRSGRKPERPGG